MAENDAGVAGARSNMVVADAGEAVIDADWIYYDKVVGASGPGDSADGEREAVQRSHGSRDDDHLVLLGSSTHTTYLAHHYR